MTFPFLHRGFAAITAIFALMGADAALAQDGTRTRYSDFAVANTPETARFAFGSAYFATLHAAKDPDERTIAVWRVDPDIDGTLVRAFNMKPPPGFSFSQDLAVSPDGRFAAWIGKDRPAAEAAIDVTVMNLLTGRTRKDTVTQRGKATAPTSCGLDFDASARRLVACVSQTYSIALMGTGQDDVRMNFFPISVSEAGAPNAGDRVRHDGGPGYARQNLGGQGLRAIGEGRRFQVLDTFRQRGLTETQTLPVVVDGTTLGARPVYEHDLGAFQGGMLAAPDGRVAVGISTSRLILMNSEGKEAASVGVNKGSTLRQGAANRDGVLFAHVGETDVKVFATHKDSLQRVLYFNAPALAAGFAQGVSGDDLIIVRKDRLSRRQITDQRVQAAGMLADAYDLWTAGFSAPGADMMIRSIGLDPTLYEYHASNNPAYVAVRRVSNGEYKVKLEDMGRVLLAEMDAVGYAPGVELGLTIEPDAQGRAAITMFDIPNHPLESVGVRKGDVITAIQGRPTPTFGEALAATRNDLGALPHGAEVSVTVDGAGGPRTLTMQSRPRIVGQPMSYKAFALSAFGYLAVQAGHPAIARQALEKMRPFLEEQAVRIGHLGPDGIIYSNLLDGLIVAKEKGAGAGYDRILALGGLSRGKFNRMQGEVVELPQAMRPLYADRAKLAYLTGRKASEIKPVKDPPPFPNPVPYPDINGNLITPAAPQPTARPIPAEQWPSAPASPSAAGPPPAGVVLD